MSTHHHTAGAVIDLDGTLVDSVPQHVVAWRRALLEAGHDVPQWRIHAGIGMGSDRLVPWLLGRHVDEADELADGHAERFLAMADDLRPTNGALALLDDLDTRGVPWIVATSSKGEEREALLAALGRQDVPLTDAGGVPSAKPAPDLVLQACEQAGIDVVAANMIGDSPWDAIAARRAGARAIGVRCGGFSETDLLAAGADRAVDDPAALVGQL